LAGGNEITAKGGDITFDGAIAGSQLLTLNAGGTVQFNDVVRSLFGLDITARNVDAKSTLTVASGGLTIDASGTVKLNDTVTATNNGIVDIAASSNITTRNITSAGGITLTSAGGTINTDNLNSSSTSSAGGDITLKSNTGAITTGNLNSSSTSSVGGDITLKSNTGAITTGNLNSSSTSSVGGDITLTSNTRAITSGDLNSSGATSGGDVQVNAGTEITAGRISTSGETARGGNVSLNSPDDIQVSSINAEGGNRGGTVEITTKGFFQATDTFLAANGLTTSISSVGGNNGGSITIRHGGKGVTPFDVGDATTNGTRGAITNGNFTIAPPQSFPYTFRQGNIGIISVNGPTRVNNPVNPVNLTKPPSSPQNPPLSSQPENSPAPDSIDKSFSSDFAKYFGLSETSGTTLTQAQNILRGVEGATSIKPAVIYAVFVPETFTPVPASGQALEKESAQLSLLRSLTRQRSDRLELILITAEGKPIRKSVNATRAEVIYMAEQFRRTVTDVQNSSGYLAPAQQMYRWLVAPLEQDLQKLGINNLVYISDTGLRTIPLAALHDGKGFIVERYSVGLMPSLALTDTRYVDIRNSQVLAMGASEFGNNASLPAVPVELANITQIWPGKSFLNQDFTLSNLKSQRAQTPFGIVHLATHAEFLPGKPANSYIQLADLKLAPMQLPSLGWTKPPVNLLVLSACRTAVGDEQVELGFAGLAVQAGVKSALASLWYVNDEGTLGLMSEFYQQLKDAPIKAEALRQAQLAMLLGKVRLQGGQLVTSDKQFPLTPALIELGNRNLSHPYYWSGFTMVGNPW
jgi:CHAT domain-containing protein